MHNYWLRELSTQFYKLYTGSQILKSYLVFPCRALPEFQSTIGTSNNDEIFLIIHAPNGRNFRSNKSFSVAASTPQLLQSSIRFHFLELSMLFEYLLVLLAKIESVFIILRLQFFLRSTEFRVNRGLQVGKFEISGLHFSNLIIAVYRAAFFYFNAISSPVERRFHRQSVVRLGEFRFVLRREQIMFVIGRKLVRLLREFWFLVLREKLFTVDVSEWFAGNWIPNSYVTYKYKIFSVKSSSGVSEIFFNNWK